MNKARRSRRVHVFGVLGECGKIEHRIADLRVGGGDIASCNSERQEKNCIMQFPMPGIGYLAGWFSTKDSMDLIHHVIHITKRIGDEADALTNAFGEDAVGFFVYDLAPDIERKLYDRAGAGFETVYPRDNANPFLTRAFVLFSKSRQAVVKQCERRHFLGFPLSLGSLRGDGSFGPRPRWAAAYAMEYPGGRAIAESLGVNLSMWLAYAT